MRSLGFSEVGHIKQNYAEKSGLEFKVFLIANSTVRRALEMAMGLIKRLSQVGS